MAVTVSIKVIKGSIKGKTVGKTVQVSARDAKILVALGRAKYTGSEAPSAPLPTLPSEPEASTPQLPENTGSTPPLPEPNKVSTRSKRNAKAETSEDKS